jgi:hypothetical protein
MGGRTVKQIDYRIEVHPGVRQHGEGAPQYLANNGLIGNAKAPGQSAQEA